MMYILGGIFFFVTYTRNSEYNIQDSLMITTRWQYGNSAKEDGKDLEYYFYDDKPDDYPLKLDAVFVFHLMLKHV